MNNTLIIRSWILILLLCWIPGKTEAQIVFTVSDLDLPFLDKVTVNKSETTIFKNTQEVGAALYKKMGIKSLEKFKQEYSYQILAKIPESNVYLLERYDADETYHWLILLNEELQLVHWIVTAYDNSDGTFIIQSIFERGLVTVFESNYYHSARKKSVAYEIRNNRFIKLADHTL